MNQKLLALYGLKWNPFSPELPVEALHVVSKVESFCWRVEQGLIREGGFAMVTGDPGTGKSVVLRLLTERLSHLRDLTVGVISHPSSNLSDFYREMGDLFGICCLADYSTTEFSPPGGADFPDCLPNGDAVGRIFQPENPLSFRND
jgi:hypothetical protein